MLDMMLRVMCDFGLPVIHSARAKIGAYVRNVQVPLLRSLLEPFVPQKISSAALHAITTTWVSYADHLESDVRSIHRPMEASHDDSRNAQWASGSTNSNLASGGYG